MTSLRPLSSYSTEELKILPPQGQLYLSQLGRDPLYDLRHTAWLESALATLQNSASSLEVCRHWSQAADALLEKVFLKHCDPTELALFAMGKLGAREVNLSSDVDLIFVSQSSRQEWVRQVRDFQSELSSLTPLGFLFRVDLDLRPGGKSSPLVPTYDQLADYYGNYGETWERIAFVRCRFVCGNSKIKTDVESFLKRFIYRKHLDFSLFEDLKGLREKIQRAVPPQDGKIHLKLAPGGIRDIELFMNALQVIHGGKNSSLQGSSTAEAFDRLQREKILPASELDFFRALYWRLRYLENYVQAQEDQQTHSILLTSGHPPQIQPALQGLTVDLSRSSLLVAGLLGSIESEAPLDLAEEYESILNIPLLSRQKDRDQKTRRIFVEKFAGALAATSGDKILAVALLKEFVTAVRAKSGLFSLLARENRLVDDLAWLFGHSPYLSRILCQRPELLDSFIYRSQELARDEVDLLLEQLLEKRLLTEIIQGTNFLKTKNVHDVLKNLSSVADEIAQELLKTLGETDLRILALGKWGGEELGFRSDLDFIFVIDGEANETHFKQARRIISRFTEPHKGGSLYAIDMRLKPSGKSGPIIVPEAELIQYLEEASETWEHQAYLKARGLNWDAGKIRAACYKKDLSRENLRTLNQIRQQLIKPSSLDLKYSEGGLLDIEIFAQSYLLEHKQRVDPTSTENMLSQIPGAEPLLQAYLDLRLKEQLLHLISSEGNSDLSKKADYIHTLAALFKMTEKEFLDAVSSLFSASIELLNQLDPRRRSG